MPRALDSRFGLCRYKSCAAGNQCCRLPLPAIMLSVPSQGCKPQWWHFSPEELCVCFGLAAATAQKNLTPRSPSPENSLHVHLLVWTNPPRASDRHSHTAHGACGFCRGSHCRSAICSNRSPASKRSQEIQDEKLMSLQCARCMRLTAPSPGPPEASEPLPAARWVPLPDLHAAHLPLSRRMATGQQTSSKGYLLDAYLNARCCARRTPSSAQHSSASVARHELFPRLSVLMCQISSL